MRKNANAMCQRRSDHADTDTRQKTDRPDQAEIQFCKGKITVYGVDRFFFPFCRCHVVSSFSFCSARISRSRCFASLTRVAQCFHARKKVPCTVNQTVQRTYVYAVPPLLFRALFSHKLRTASRNHSFDCNVSQRAVLKPLGAGFQMLPAKALSALRTSLCYFPHSTLLVNVLFSILFAQKSYFYSMPDNFKSKVLIFSFSHLWLSNARRMVYITCFPTFAVAYAFFPQHFLYFLPLPQGQGSLG